MLDIQFIRDNSELVALKSKQKGYKVDVAHLLEIDKQRRALLTDIEDARQKRNQFTQQLNNSKPSMADIEIGKKLRNEVTELENQLLPIVEKFDKLLKQIPNMPLDEVPVGNEESDNQVLKEIGDPHKYDFAPKKHGELAESLGWIDKERAAKIAGSRFTYIKGDLVLLQLALIQFVVAKLTDKEFLTKLIDENGLHLDPKPFVPVLPPPLINTESYEASTRLNAKEVTYKIEGDDLWLNASAEHSLCNMYMGEILTEEELPIRYLGYSTSFRREAGTYGKDTEGIIRLHHFDKLEMEVFSAPQTGLEEHKLLIAIQEYLVAQLGLPYRVILKSTFDIGKPNASGVDIDTWFPGEDSFRETHTADYMTDYQARRLKTRLKSAVGDNNATSFVHTNDATAFALGRIMAAIIENYQTKDGHVTIPEILRPLLNNRQEI